MEILILGIIFLPIIIGTLIYFFNSSKVNKLIFPLQVSLTFISALIIKAVIIGGDVSYIIGKWEKGIGIELRVDYLSILFMTMGIIGFWYVYLYVWDDKKTDSKFLFFITFLQGVIYANFFLYDIFSIYVILELITIISSILILYKKDGESVRAGFYYLIFNSIGMCFFLVGTMVIYINTGTLNGTVIKNMILEIGLTYEIMIGFSFMLVAFFIKAALFPVCSWLPIAHSAAPNAISALLSGLIVKIGIYGIIRIVEIFNINVFNDFLMVIGIITSLFGIYFAVCQTDIKKILAYHTISQVGLIMIGISSANFIGKFGGIIHIFNHFLFKSLLFLCAGIIIDIYGYRNIKRMKGLWKKDKIVSILLIIGMLSITGAPFFIGNISKTIIKSGEYSLKMKFIFQIINLGTVISFTKLSSILFGWSDKFSRKGNLKNYAIIFLGIIILAMYPFEIFLIDKMGVSVKILKLSSIVKEFLNYFIYIGISLIVYFKILKKSPRLVSKFDGFYVGFQEANTRLVFLVGILILYIKYFIL